MINNAAGDTGVLDFATLKQLIDSNESLKELVTKIDQNSVTFQPFGDEPGAPEEMPADDQGAGKAKDPTTIVNKMADRAMNKRS